MSQSDANQSQAPSGPGLGFEPIVPETSTNSTAPTESQAPDYSEPPPPYPGTNPSYPAYPPKSGYPPTSGAYNTPGITSPNYGQGAGYNTEQYGSQQGQYNNWATPPTNTGTSQGQPQVVHYHHPPGSMAGQPMATTSDGQTVVVIKTGNCPNCQVGVIVEDFTCAGLCLGIFFFPFGLICCLAMRDRHCNNCQARF